MPTLNRDATGVELRQQRARIVESMRTLHNRAEAADRGLEPGERAEFDRLDAAQHELSAAITRAEAAEQRARDEAPPPADPHGDDGDLAGQFRDRARRNSREPIEVAWTRSLPNGRQVRDLTTGTGGGLVPTGFYNQILAYMTENSAILAAGARLLTTPTGETMHVPRATARSAASIVAEGAVIPESDPSIDSVQLDAFKYAFLVQVTRELVTDSTFDLVGYLAEQAGTALSNSAGAHFVAGTGSGQPRGVLSDATPGVTGAAADGGFTADELIGLAHSVPAPYARNASWLVNNTTLAGIRQLKGSDEHYLFNTDVAGGQAPGTLLGRPVYIDPTMPDVAAGATPILFGDFSRFWVRQVGGLRFERSDDFAFDRDLVSFRGVWRGDGKLVDETAVRAFVGGA